MSEPVFGRLHAPAEERPIPIEKVVVVELVRDTESIRRMSVKRDIDVAHDSHAALRDRPPHRLHVGLVLHAEVVRTVTRIQQIGMRNEKLKKRATHCHQTGMHLLLRKIGHELRIVLSPEVLHSSVEILHDRVDVVQANGLDGRWHASSSRHPTNAVSAGSGGKAHRYSIIHLDATRLAVIAVAPVNAGAVASAGH
jgi:hypothetical protein